MCVAGILDTSWTYNVNGQTSSRFSPVCIRVTSLPFYSVPVLTKLHDDSVTRSAVHFWSPGMKVLDE